MTTPNFTIRPKAFEVVHDEHRARFRQITVDEQARAVHYWRQLAIAEKIHLEMRGEEVPGHLKNLPDHFDGNAMLPRGVSVASNGTVVVGLNDANEPTWVLCEKCVDLGGEAIAHDQTAERERLLGDAFVYPQPGIYPRNEGRAGRMGEPEDAEYIAQVCAKVACIPSWESAVTARLDRMCTLSFDRKTATLHIVAPQGSEADVRAIALPLVPMGIGISVTSNPNH